MTKKNLVNYDTDADVLYIVTKKGQEESVLEIAPGINVELGEKGEIIGIEILHASKVFKPIAKPLYHQMELVKA
ncbi:MAG: DUF2283 domain-containing protein [Candidatus Firestonebacteria bacterium]